MKNNVPVILTFIIALVLAVVFFLLASPDKDRQNAQKDDTQSAQESSHTLEQGIPFKTYSKKRDAASVLGTLAVISPAPLSPENTEKIPVKTVSFLAVGDNLIHGSVYTDAKDNAKGTDQEYDFTPMYAHIAQDIAKADIAFVNQESPFAQSLRPISGYPMFNTPDQAGYDLVKTGFDIVNLANNHMLDSTAKGYLRTIEFWEKIPDVLAIGGYKNKQDFENIRVIEKNGISIALLAYTYGTNGIHLPKDSPMIIPLCDKNTVDRQTKQARTLADFVVVSVHWGIEDRFTPTDTQKELAQIMVNNGVDVVIGHHPHVLQPLTWEERPDGGKTLIMYSLGNFLSGMMYSRNMVGGMLQFDLMKAPNGTSVENVSFIPTMCQYDKNVRNFELFRFSEYTEEQQKVHGAHKFDNGMSLKSMRHIIDETIPKEFLTESFYKN